MNPRVPRKPSEPLATIVFRAGGRGAHMVVEPLPEAKEDLELAIVTKFIGAIRTHGIILNPPTRGDREWPDFETSRPNGDRVGIEVVEVVDPDHAQKRARQSHYLKELLPRLSGLTSALDGLVLTVDDGYQTPQWPPVRTPEGRRLLSHFVECLHADAAVLAQVPPGPGTYRRWDFEGLQVGIMAMRGRRLDGFPSTGIDLRFSGTFPTNSTLLARTVLGKLRKSYGHYDRGDLWLLAYAGNGLGIDDDVVSCARTLLDAAPHPFVEVWSFFPVPGAAMGFAAKVFP